MLNVVYNADYFPSFKDFGLNIPMANQRFFDIFDHLPAKSNIIKVDKAGEDFPNRLDLLRVHSKDYVDGLFNKSLPGIINRCFEYTDEHGHSRYADKFPDMETAEKLRDHIFKKVFQVKKTMEVALNDGFGVCLGGGMHHARRDFGHGFCLVNDFLIATYHLINEQKIKNALVIDVDAHMGDGTIDCVYRDNRIWTIDLHMKNGWPNNDGNLKLKAEANIHVPLEKGEENKYLLELQNALEQTNQLSFQTQKPDIAICLLGADPYEEDELDSTSEMNLSLEQLFKRDQMIYQFLTAYQIPVCVLLAGGYGKNSWKVTSQFLDWVSTQIK